MHRVCPSTACRLAPWSIAERQVALEKSVLKRKENNEGIYRASRGKGRGK